MWQSRMFWRLFGFGSGLVLLTVGLVAWGGGQQVWTMAGLTVGGGLLLAFWLARRLTLPLRELTSGAEQIAGGSYGFKVYAGGGDELGQLSRTFNYMSERLADQFAQLDQDRQQLRTVLSSMVEGVVAIDAEQRILFANERAGQLLGIQPGSTAGRHLWELVRHRPLQELVRAGLANAETQVDTLSWTGGNARRLAIHVTRLPGLPPPGAVLVLHDVTELQRLERLRQEFVANVSHELKTPLAVIKACVETLLDGAVDDLDHRGTFLQRIGEQADRLHRLILDLLMLARIESEERDGLLWQEVPLAEVVQDCLDRQRPLAESQGQKLLAVSPEQPLTAWADEEAIGQILDNLVDNALKYTPAGGTVWVRWGREGDQAFLEVQDTGIGIPEKDLARIFERFYRVDKARSRELGGTGLGLAIVKHLTQALHGTVRATSVVDQGSTFTVRWPLSPDRFFADSSPNPHTEKLQ